MTKAAPDPKDVDFALLQAGPSYRFDQLLTSLGLHVSRRYTKILLIILITWGVPLVISVVSGRATGGEVTVPFLHDPVAYCRFLIVIPLLELAEVAVALTLKVQTGQFVKSGVIPERSREQFQSRTEEVAGLSTAGLVEVAIVVLSFAIAFFMRVVVFRTEGSSWAKEGTAITLAGWWYVCVSLPILLWFLLRWLWVFLLWSWFLFRVSRLELELVPTHPDRAGGLGFLGWGVISFSSVVIAVSTIFAGGFAYEIVHRGQSLESLKYHLIVVVVIALVILHAPLLAFSGKLSHCRFKGLLEFGAVVWRYDRAFEEKWIETPERHQQEMFLGSSDIQSLADIATAHKHIEEMWLIPFDFKATMVVALAAVLPFVPLLWTTIPMPEILAKLLELVA